MASSDLTGLIFFSEHETFCTIFNRWLLLAVIIGMSRVFTKDDHLLYKFPIL